MSKSDILFTRGQPISVVLREPVGDTNHPYHTIVGIFFDMTVWGVWLGPDKAGDVAFIPADNIGFITSQNLDKEEGRRD